MIIYFMICYLQRGDMYSVSASIILYYLELKLNASSIFSSINAYSIKFTVIRNFMMLHNVTMLQFLYILNYIIIIIINIINIIIIIIIIMMMMMIM